MAAFLFALHVPEEIRGEGMVFTEYIKQRILFHHFCGSRGSEIQRELAEREEITASKVSIGKFICWYLESATIALS